MANILLTTRCNLKCKYCFASDVENECPGQEISMENFLVAKNFLLESQCKRIGLIGGEPTTHRNFKDILENCVMDERVSEIVLYTNGIFSEEYLNIFANSKIAFLVNCNSPDDIGDKFNILMKNLNELTNTYYAYNRITLGINLYSNDQDFSYILNLCKEFRKRDIRVSVCVPQNNEDRQKYFSNMKEVLIRFYKEACEQGIKPHYDCNIIPSCFYTEKELFEIATLLSDRGSERERLIGEKCLCKPVIDILPDLTAIRCFGMSEKKVSIKQFRNMQDLTRFFLKEIDFSLLATEKNNKCKNCYKNKTLKCMGGCLKFKNN